MKNKNKTVTGQGFAHLEISQDDISVIRFEGVQVRIIKVNNEPWFIFKDVCKALGISKYRDAFSRLDADERGGRLKWTPLVESRLYQHVQSLAFTKRLPAAAKLPLQALLHIVSVTGYSVTLSHLSVRLVAMAFRSGC